MTRKDYVLLAQVLAEARPAQNSLTFLHQRQWQDTVDIMAAVLAQDNPRFNKTTFLRAIEKAGETDAT
jgi:hypothetical protein